MRGEPSYSGDHLLGEPRMQDEEVDMTEDEGQAKWNVAEWHGKTLVDRTARR